MGSVGTRKAAPSPILGQSERASGGGSRGKSRSTPARRPIRAALVPPVDLGAWFSPRLRPPHGSLLSGRRNGRSSQAVDPAQDPGEQGARHRHLGELEHDIAAVAHDPGADLHQPLAQGRERPLRDLLVVRRTVGVVFVRTVRNGPWLGISTGYRGWLKHHTQRYRPPRRQRSTDQEPYCL